MPPGRSKMALEESWVVEEDYSAEVSPQEEEPVAEAKLTPPKRRTRDSKSIPKSPDPEFVMPSLNNSMDGSWANSPSHTRHRNINRPSEKMQEGRRPTRAASHNGSPEKRSKVEPSARYMKAPPVRYAPSHSPSIYPPENFLDLAINHTASMVSWMLDVLRGALRILKTPISYLLAIWLLFGLGLMIRNLITTSIYSSLTPICRIPGSSLLNLPFCQNVEIQPPQHVEFDELMTVQANFEKVLEESAGGASLPLDMKRGEASIRDLRQLVRYSHLQSR
jgi:hypothetical protein